MLGEKGGEGGTNLPRPPPPTTMQTSLNFRNFAELYPHLLKAYHFQI